MKSLNCCRPGPRKTTNGGDLVTKFTISLLTHLASWSDAHLKSVPVSRFGKDHWSLLAYVETLCVDSTTSVGRLDPLRVRCNPKRHPLMAASRFGDRTWNSTYGTRLRASRSGNVPQLKTHDDWDCLDDLEAAGLVEIVSVINGFVRLTDQGLKVAHSLREHKAKGGVFATFRWSAKRITSLVA